MAAKESAFWAERKAELWTWGQRVKAGERTWAEVAAHFGKSYASCSQKFSELQSDPTFDRLPIVTAAAPPSCDPEELWQEAEKKTARDLAREAKRRLVSIEMDERKPFGLTWISDQHIRGSGPVNLTRMREDAELTATTPGLFAMLGGDATDNHLKHRAAMVNGGTKISEDQRRFDHYLGFFKGKILGMISGNHDDWTKDFAATDVVGMLAAKHRIFYAPDELVATITAGKASWTVGVRHQYRYESSFNGSHAVKRWWEMGMDDWDVGVLCHKHEPECVPFFKHGKLRWALRPGSYQLTSTYSTRYGYNHTLPTCPTAIFWPATGRVKCEMDVHDAADYLTWIRAKKSA